jgi:hypothetical protein
VKRTYKVRCNDEVEAQRSRWTFYETIKHLTLRLTERPLHFLKSKGGGAEHS